MLDSLKSIIGNYPYVLDVIKICLLPTLLFVLNCLLDLDIGRVLVKHLNFINFIVARATFRDRPISISGTWEQTWELDIKKSTSTSEEEKKKYDNGILKSPSITKIKQLGRFCYAEFTDNSKTKEETYIFWGKIEGQYVYGQWYNKATDRKNNLGYFGSFQLKIKSADEMSGLWIGHSENDSKINTGVWSWKKQNEVGFFERILNFFKASKSESIETEKTTN